jgi:beta-phosphoglucomutase-like phosphatase (HAD superfamily)
VAVATSAVPANAARALARVGLAGRFRVLVTAADVSHGKPHPEPYLTAARRLGVDAARCLVVEDSVSGLRAGHAAGATCLALATTFPRATLAAESPRWVAGDFTDLPGELLDALVA